MSGWRDEAACRDSSVEFFGGHRVKDRLAKQVCGGCPVRARCLAVELGWERARRHSHLTGVFGGLSGPERERLLDGGKASWVVAT